jgi:hypothetical protein
MPEKRLGDAAIPKDERSDVYGTLARIRLVLDDALAAHPPSRRACGEVASTLRALKLTVDAGQSEYERQLVESEIRAARTRVVAFFGNSAWDDPKPQHSGLARRE